MTQTARDTITDALEDLGVIPAGVAPTSVQAIRGLRRLNRMMHGWKGQGVDIGHVTMEDLSDEIALAPEHHDAVTALLAVFLAPTYLVSVTPELAGVASAGWSGLQAAYIINDLNKDMTVETGLRRIGSRPVGTYTG